ncbi:OsmC family protein [Burkholderia metallica]|uniref:OsmC family protein n=1 Tax=Burkholderia metallica TaxID=488729 RepID=UPI001CF3D373|nr:OsmC family protein [Burkholderia metallica]MCA8003333.1 OsmC family protein [Burkholderia metallica]
MDEERVFVDVIQVERFRFRVEFPDTAAPTLVTDELQPLGDGRAPNPIRLLGAAVANCLAASLLYSLQKYRNDPHPVTAHIEVALIRDTADRLRVGSMAVELKAGKKWAELAHAARALARFEEFCTVTESVRHGIPVTVNVTDIDGEQFGAVRSTHAVVSR